MFPTLQVLGRRSLHSTESQALLHVADLFILLCGYQVFRETHAHCYFLEIRIAALDSICVNRVTFALGHWAHALTSNREAHPKLFTSSTSSFVPAAQRCTSFIAYHGLFAQEPLYLNGMALPIFLKPVNLVFGQLNQQNQETMNQVESFPFQEISSMEASRQAKVYCAVQPKSECFNRW